MEPFSRDGGHTQWQTGGTRGDEGAQIRDPSSFCPWWPDRVVLGLGLGCFEDEIESVHVGVGFAQG